MPKLAEELRYLAGRMLTMAEELDKLYSTGVDPVIELVELVERMQWYRYKMRSGMFNRLYRPYRSLKREEQERKGLPANWHDFCAQLWCEDPFGGTLRRLSNVGSGTIWEWRQAVDPERFAEWRRALTEDTDP